MAGERTSSIVMLLCALILTSGAWGKTIYVDDDAPAGGDGISWFTAYRFLQDALANAGPEAVEIRVAQGLYRPDRSSADSGGAGDRQIAFVLIDGATVVGGYAGLGAVDPNARDVQAYETVLTGDLAGNDEPVADPWGSLDNDPTRADNSFHVVMIDGTDPNTTLAGVTISGAYEYVSGVPLDWPEVAAGLSVGTGARLAVRDCTFSGNLAPAMRCAEGSEVVLSDCTFRDNINTVESHGALVVYGAKAHLSRCTFERNYSQMGSGGISCYSQNGYSDLWLEDCEFLENASRWGILGSSMGGLFGNVGGALSSHGSAELLRCEFRGNSAGAGGAVDLGGSVTVKDCGFKDNRAFVTGGAMLLQGAGSEITGCVFSNNKASWDGAVHQANGRSDFVGCLFSGNKSTGASGGVISITGYPTAGWGRYPIRPAFDVRFEHCTFARNIAPKGPARAVTSGALMGGNLAPGVLVVSNCIIDDGGDEIHCKDTEMTITHTNLRGGLDAIDDPCDGLSWGPGNIDADPLFVDPGYWDDNGTADDPDDDFFVEGDYHLKSQAGRWDAAASSWVQDDATSPCIDAGDPNSPIMYEPFPNGGIVNMGTYGGTAEASKSYFGGPVCETIIAGDINGDCKVDIDDLILLLSHWTNE